MPVPTMRMLAGLAAVVAAAALSLPGTVGPAEATQLIPLSGPVTWSARLGPVPKADTHTAPALATITLPGGKTRRLLFWTGPVAGGGVFQISYQTSISLRRNLWSGPGLVDSGKATTQARAAAAPIGATGSGQVIVVWNEAKASSILYSIGKAGKGTALTWGPTAAIPGAATSNGPAVFSALDSDTIIVVWKVISSDSIDFVVGKLAGSTAVKWGKIGVIKGAATTTTPAIAEANTGKDAGALYVFWKTPGSLGRIDFAATTDPLPSVPKWTKPRPLPSKVRTPTAPSAQAIGKQLRFPLLIVFQRAGGSTLDYVTLGAHNEVAGPFAVPHIKSANGTAISPGVLAAQAPGTLAAARAPDPENVFYEPFVRPCAGC